MLVNKYTCAGLSPSKYLMDWKPVDNLKKTLKEITGRQSVSCPLEGTEPSLGRTVGIYLKDLSHSCLISVATQRPDGSLKNWMIQGGPSLNQNIQSVVLECK